MSKTKLEPREVLMVAHAHIIGEIDQHSLASMFGINSARVAEAIVAMRWAMENHKQLYDQVKGSYR